MKLIHTIDSPTPNHSPLSFRNTTPIMYIYPATIGLLFLCFTVITHGSGNPAQLSGDISINCGWTVNSAAINGKEWLGEAQPQSSSILEIGGSSTTSAVIHNAGDDAVPYTTARISRSQFFYAFRVSPGQKILLLHFNPVPYKGFKGFKDLFTVEVGGFKLLGNFSASLTAQALGVNSIVKEFCLYIHEDDHLNIIFSPSYTSPLQDVYAFINGIEIISVPSSLSYFHGADTAVQVVGQKSQVYVDYYTALELVHRLKFRQISDPSNGVFDHVFPVWVAQKAYKANNSTWRIPVDVGFRYLIRLHFSELGVKTLSSNVLMFKVLINEMIAQTNVDIGEGWGGNSIPWNMDYMVVVRGPNKLIKRDLVISLCSYDTLVDIDGTGVLVGFEVFKLSNHDDSLAAPNPLPPARAKTLPTFKTVLSGLGYRYATANVLILILFLVNVVGHKSRAFWEAIFDKGEYKPSVRAQGLCRRFSLSEIQLATKNFSRELLIGRGGFGKVYKGMVDNGETTVAIKRLKSNSSQGAHEFLTEIETLSQLRHDNLVSLIGYCNQYGEMILVYDYMAGGTLSEHLYKPPRDSNARSSLTWKQRLIISIGAARGLDYLHTGNKVIHRDVKTSNILLDENFVAKVSDFGLVKHEDKSNLKSHVSTRVKGTRGYVDPYYMNTCKLTEKSDTYAFGVVLLEILCGRPAVDLWLLEDEQILTKWARENINHGNIDQIVCPTIRDEVSNDCLSSFVAVAERCLLDEPKQRPTMAQVVLQLGSVLEQQNSKQVSGLSNVANISEDIKDDLSVKTGQQTMDSMDFLDRKHPFSEEGDLEGINNFSTEISTGREDRTGFAMHKPSWFQTWDAFWNRVKPSNKNKLLLSEIREADVSALQLSWNKIVAATNNFSHKLGQGGFGSVYKGVLPSGRVVAAKRLSPSSSQGTEQFKNEFLFLLNLQHRNIIKVLGYCVHRKERLIIYEFMENGSLDTHMGGKHLKWKLRFEIIMGIAQGVVYLHQDSGKRVIYKSLKCANILLNGKMNPKLSDFEFATTLEENESERYLSEIAGTIGYISPEEIQQSRCSLKSDVYSFGVVVLEIIVGRRINQDRFDAGHMPLIDLAWKLWNENRELELVDESLVGPFPEEEALRCIQVALLCIQEHPYDRPTMPFVVRMLEGAHPMSEPHEPWPLTQSNNFSDSSLQLLDTASTTRNKGTAKKVI